jgi:hypothetical protein
LRYSALIGSILAAAFAGVGLGAASYGMAPSTLRLRDFSETSGRIKSEGPQHLKTQRHTGAGGAGMHAAWKKRRAAGRA